MPQLGLGSSLSRGGVISAGFPNAYSLDFDGTDSVTLDSTVSFTGVMSLSIWCYPDSLTTNDQIVKQSSFLSALMFWSTTVFKLRTANTYSAEWTPGGTISTSAWSHLVFVRNSSNVWTNYLNGTPQSTTITHSGDMDVDIIGNNCQSKLDELALWDAELDADAVTAIYNSGTPIALDVDAGNYDNSGDLQGWWRFEEGSGTTAADSSGKANSGTFNGDPTFSTDAPG